jgi:hypothetical protein
VNETQGHRLILGLFILAIGIESWMAIRQKYVPFPAWLVRTGVGFVVISFVGMASIEFAGVLALGYLVTDLIRLLSGGNFNAEYGGATEQMLTRSSKTPASGETYANYISHMLTFGTGPAAQTQGTVNQKGSFSPTGNGTAQLPSTIGTSEKGPTPGSAQLPTTIGVNQKGSPLSGWG